MASLFYIGRYTGALVWTRNETFTKAVNVTLKIVAVNHVMAVLKEATISVTVEATMDGERREHKRGH